MGNRIKVNINKSFSLNFNAGITVLEIAREYKKATGKCVMGAKINNVIIDPYTKIFEDTKISFFDYTDQDGNKMYQAGLKYIFVLAVKLLWCKNVYFKYSIDKGIFAEIDKKITDEDVEELKAKMREIIDYDYPIKKCITRREDAIRYCESMQEIEKAKNIHNIPNEYVQLYEINHTYDYFYTEMPPSTGKLELFDIKRIDKNSIALMYPRVDSKGEIPDFNFNELVYAELLKYSRWSKRMNTEYVSELNKIISEGHIQKFIKLNNIFVNESLYTIAKDIVKKSKDVKLILIGGPSSSGKTTSAHKLCYYLETFGLKPIVISADDYFKDRNTLEKDKDGNYDYESLKALDLDLFNTHLKKLLKGEEVTIPTFNFIQGKKEYKNDPIKMNDDNVLLIEGIHCLNDAMTKGVKRENKYKVYVCPFTPLSLDAHNHLSTTDMRLIRRIVRDNRVRGKDVIGTLKDWPSVKKGEDKNIYPYTNDCDAVLNTAYAYEVGVLRVYAEPLLYNVEMNSEFYNEARRLLGLLRMFYPISSEYIEDDNTLREFIGGSIYDN